MDQVEILKSTIGGLILQIISLQAQVVALEAQLKEKTNVPSQG